MMRAESNFYKTDENVGGAEVEYVHCLLRGVGGGARKLRVTNACREAQMTWNGSATRRWQQLSQRCCARACGARPPWDVADAPGANTTAKQNKGGSCRYAAPVRGAAGWRVCLAQQVAPKRRPRCRTVSISKLSSSLEICIAIAICKHPNIFESNKS